MFDSIYVRCKECQTPFRVTSEKDLAALGGTQSATRVIMCPQCLSLRPYVAEDALVAIR